VFSRNAVSGQGDILGKEWMLHVFGAGVWRKQSGFCTSTNDPLKRGHLVKQILLLIIVLWNYELASKLDSMQHTTSPFHAEYASSLFAISNTVRTQGTHYNNRYPFI